MHSLLQKYGAWTSPSPLRQAPTNAILSILKMPVEDEGRHHENEFSSRMNVYGWPVFMY